MIRIVIPNLNIWLYILYNNIRHVYSNILVDRFLNNWISIVFFNLFVTNFSGKLGVGVRGVYCGHHLNLSLDTQKHFFLYNLEVV